MSCYKVDVKTQGPIQVDVKLEKNFYFNPDPEEGIQYANIATGWTGTEVSFREGDEGARYINGEFNNLQIDNPAVIARLDLEADDFKGTLLNDNIFGNKNRYTDVFGEQNYPSFRVGANTVDSRIVIDHLYGVALCIFVKGPAGQYRTNYQEALDDVRHKSFNGYAGLGVMTHAEAQRITILNRTIQDGWGYPPIEVVFAGAILCTSTARIDSADRVFGIRPRNGESWVGDDFDTERHYFYAKNIQEALQKIQLTLQPVTFELTRGTDVVFNADEFALNSTGVSSTFVSVDTPPGVEAVLSEGDTVVTFSTTLLDATTQNIPVTISNGQLQSSVNWVADVQNSDIFSFRQAISTTGKTTGNGEYVALDDTFLDGSTRFSMNFWATGNPNNDAVALIAKAITASQRIQIDYNQPNRELRIFLNDGTTQLTTFSNVYVDGNSMVTFTFDGTLPDAEKGKAYVNGVFLGNCSTDITAAITGGNFELQRLKFPGGGGTFLIDGNINEVGIIDGIVLNQLQISTLYNNGDGNLLTNVVPGLDGLNARYYRCNKNTEGVLIDEIDRANDGVLNGFEGNYYIQIADGTKFADIVSNITEVFSLEMESDASIVAFQAYGPGTDTFLDIGFDENGDLDTAALIAFAISGDGSARIATWYGQGGLGKNVDNANNGALPIIVQGGVLVTENGFTAAQFGAARVLLNATFDNPSTVGTVMTVVKTQDEGGVSQVVTDANINVNRQISMFYRFPDDVYSINQGAVANSTVSTDANLNLLTTVFDTLDDGYVNGVKVIDQQDAGNSTRDGLRVGAVFNNGAYFEGKMLKIVLFDGVNKTAELGTIEQLIADQYGITLG